MALSRRSTGALKLGKASPYQVLAASTSVRNPKAGSSNLIRVSGCALFLAGHRPTQEHSKHAYMTRRTGMPKKINPWAMYSRKTSTASLPEALKMEVTSSGNHLTHPSPKPAYTHHHPAN